MKSRSVVVQKTFAITGFDWLLLLLVVFAGLWGFWTSFSFGLFGDDWHHYFFIMDCRALDYPCLRFIFHPYGGETLFMNIMEEFFKFNSLAYYIVSFIFRSFSVVTFYALIKYLTKTRIFAFTAALFLMVSLGGIETTDWVHYANVYIAAGLLNLGFLLFFRYYYENIAKNRVGLIKYFLLFFLAIIITPVRLHGILFLYPATELTLLLLKKENYKNTLTRIAIFLLMVIVIRKLGFFGSQEEQSTFVQGTLDFITASGRNFLQALFTPLGTLSNMLFPRDTLGSVINTKIYYSLITKKIFILFMIPSVVINIFLAFASKKKTILFTLPVIGWALYLLALRYIYPLGLEVAGREMLIGGVALFMVISLINYLLINKYSDHAFKQLFFLMWPFAFIFVPHLFNPASVMTAEARYLNIPTAGAIAIYIYSLYVFTNVVITDFSDKFEKKLHKYLHISALILFSLISSYLIIYNFSLVRLYFSTSYYRRNAQTVNKAFKNTVNIIDNYSLGDYPIIIFDYDESDFFHDTVYFGGGFRYAVEKGIVETIKFPVFMGTGDLESEAAEPGFIKNKYGRDLSENKNIIGIRILKTGEVTDITKEIRTEIDKTVKNN